MRTYALFSPVYFFCRYTRSRIVPVNPAKVQLGKALFFDPILSADGTVSCASCHDLYDGGDDGRRVSVGIRGQKGSINAPTVLNAVFNFRQFWDGRAKDLQEQATGPSSIRSRWATTSPI